MSLLLYNHSRYSYNIFTYSYGHLKPRRLFLLPTALLHCNLSSASSSGTMIWFNLGRPRGLRLWILAVQMSLTMVNSSLLKIWPIHLSLLLISSAIISGSVYKSLTNLFFRILYSSPLDRKFFLLRNIFSKVISFFYQILVIVHFFAPYSRRGWNIVLYILSLHSLYNIFLFVMVPSSNWSYLLSLICFVFRLCLLFTVTSQRAKCDCKGGCSECHVSIEFLNIIKL